MNWIYGESLKQDTNEITCWVLVKSKVWFNVVGLNSVYQILNNIIVIYYQFPSVLPFGPKHTLKLNLLYNGSWIGHRWLASLGAVLILFYQVEKTIVSNYILVRAKIDGLWKIGMHFYW